MNQPISGDELLNFFKTLDDYTPTLPDSLTAHYLSQAGLHTSDPRIIRLVSLAAQKFITEVASDALTHSQMRGNPAGGSSASGNKKSKEKKNCLRMEDLQPALADMGIQVKKPAYYM